MVALLTGLTGVLNLTPVSTAGASSSPPTAPTNVAAVPGNAAATITWTDPSSNNGSAITSYTVLAISGGIGTKVGSCSKSSCVSLTISKKSGALINGTAYTFEVYATNAGGNSPDSVASSAIVIGAPTAPTNVSAVPGSGAATISWTDPSSKNGSTIKSYTVIASTNGGPAAGATCSGATCASLTMTNGTIYGTLNNGTAYTFQVLATNARGNSPDSAASLGVTVGAPIAPTHVSAVPGVGEATVSWTDPSTDNGSAVSGYTVYAYNSSGGLAAANVCTGGSCSTLILSNGFLYGTLVDGSGYTFEVFATNGSGNSPNSAASASVVIESPSICSPNVNVTSATPSTTTSGDPASNVYDGNLGDFWSSDGHSTADNTESLAYWWSGGFQNINQVQLYPRASAYGFPVDFTIYYSNGSSWEWAQTVNNYAPHAGQWNDISLDQMVSANGILIVASVLSADSYGNFYFQMAEVNAGCSALIGNDVMLEDGSPQPNVSPANEQPELSLTGGQIISRATTWLDSMPPVPYNESEYWASPTDYWGDGQGNAPAPGGSPPAWREDCSGFVSQAWGFSDSDGGFTTYAFSTGDNQFTSNAYATLLPSWSDLEPGDALVYNGPTLGDGTSHHMVLFAGWQGTPGASNLLIFQEGDSETGTYAAWFSPNDPVLSQFLPIRSVGYSTAPPPPPPSQTSDIVRSADGQGYYILSPGGGVYAYGGAPFYGSAAGQSYFAGQTAVALVVDPNGSGYWIFAASGAVYAYGGAPFEGSTSPSYFAGQVAVGAISSSDGNGYTIVSNTGGVYAYGDGTFNGSAAGQSYFSGQTAVAVIPSRDAKGYAILAADGAVYAYGDQGYYGGASSSYFSGQTAASFAPSADGAGYGILSQSGGVYAFGDFPYLGGPGGQSYFSGLSAVAFAATADGQGYWVVSNTGGVYAYGDAPYEGGGV
jgi:hypothetical protein